MERVGKALHKSWMNYSQGAGILFIAAAISYGVLEMFSVDGPVVTVTDGPHLLTKTVPYRGQMVYKISSRRNSSCPGVSIIQFTSLEEPRQNVVLTRPVVLPNIGEHKDVRVTIELPRSVFPGKWTYQLSLDSQCPTFTRADLIARFPIEVTNDVD